MIDKYSKPNLNYWLTALRTSAGGGIMSASVSRVVGEQLLSDRDQQLQGEEPSTELVDDKWSSRKTMVFTVSGSLIPFPSSIQADDCNAGSRCP